MTKSGATSDPPLIEWLIGGLGALLFSAIIAVLAASALGGGDAPPDVRLRVDAISVVRGGYLVEFTAENSGDRVAADVEIAAALTGGESARAHFDYLPPHASRRGGVFFRSDPRAGELTLSAQGYSDP